MVDRECIENRYDKHHTHYLCCMMVKQRLSNREKCCRAATYYQSKFPSVTPLSSRELLEQWSTVTDSTSNTEYILVDVRTKAERDVSMIQGAVSLSEYYQRYQEMMRSPPPSDKHCPRQAVVCYCTIGYRSGLEATRLRQVIESNNESTTAEIIVYNLDGIVAMSQALSAQTGAAAVAADTEFMLQRPLSLVIPSTGSPTRVVHTFSWLWDWVDMSDEEDTTQVTSADTERYASTYFSTPLVCARLLQVSMLIALRYSQTLWFYCHHKTSKLISRG
jgi:rhodanese-related sulfurtransferase